MADETTDLRKTSIYHIRVKGNLDEKWADWFEGFVMTSRDDGETLLTGAVVDQAALHGVLGKIHSLGLPLLLVAQTDCPCSSKKLSQARAVSRMRSSSRRQGASCPSASGRGPSGTNNAQRSQQAR